jgi:hypothetical protein
MGDCHTRYPARRRECINMHGDSVDEKEERWLIMLSDRLSRRLLAKIPLPTEAAFYRELHRRRLIWSVVDETRSSDNVT